MHANDGILAMVDAQTRARVTLNGRRVQKKVWTYSGGSWGSPVVRKYVWSGWLLMMELEGGVGVPPANQVVRKYTWGLDLAGQMGGVGVPPANLEAAGGIGGLLAVSDPNDPNDPNDPVGDFVYLYDGNGNVSQVVNWSYDSNDATGAIVAKYEYDPFGRRINYDPNLPEYDQPWRWSTKYLDAETGLANFGGRYYHAGLGRWINRDPIEELGGANLYSYVLNNPTNRVDYLGRMAIPCEGGTCGCPGKPNSGQGEPPDPKAPVTPPHGLPRPVTTTDECVARYGACSAPGGWTLGPGGKCRCGEQRYRPGGPPYKPGPEWPNSCVVLYAQCLITLNSAITCGQAYNRCMDAAGKNEDPRPSHEGHYIDPWCWFFRGTGGCPEPTTSLLPLFSLCDSSSGQRDYRFCSENPLRGGYPASCMSACQAYIQTGHCKQYAGEENCTPEACKDVCKPPAPAPPNTVNW